MKKTILIITLFTAIQFTGYGQSAPSTGSAASDQYNLYSVKAKKQKTLAWAMLGGGTALTVIGIATFPKGYDFLFGNDPATESKANVASVMGVCGTLSMLGSIPLFIAAGKNRFRARLMLSNQKTTFQLPGRINKNIPGIGLSIPIGK